MKKTESSNTPKFLSYLKRPLVFAAGQKLRAPEMVQLSIPVCSILMPKKIFGRLNCEKQEKNSDEQLR